MKKIIITIAAMMFAATATTAIDTPYIHKVNGIDPFNTIHVSANAKISVVDGKQYDVEVLTSDSIIKKGFNCYVEDSVLFIKERIFDAIDKPIDILVTTPQILKPSVTVGSGYEIVRK